LGIEDWELEIGNWELGIGDKNKKKNLNTLHVYLLCMKNQMVSARVNLNPYVNKVLGIVKLKYDLRDKSEAINKFVEMYGENIIEKDASSEYAKKVMKIADKHFKNYGDNKMTLEELDSLCGV
jgi:hypothetical protein